MVMNMTSVWSYAERCLSERSVQAATTQRTLLSWTKRSASAAPNLQANASQSKKARVQRAAAGRAKSGAAASGAAECGGGANTSNTVWTFRRRIGKKEASLGWGQLQVQVCVWLPVLSL
jgi:hypothetical protein